jgi:hypothetical protein
LKTNPDVEKLLEEKNHPLDTEIRRVREIILASDDRVKEAVKWKSPTFIYNGNIATFNMTAKKHVSLMFHKGALIDDASGLLEGDGKEARSAKFYGAEDIEEKKTALESVIATWIKMRDDQ